MGFNCGIVGLPNVGKSTLFNAITAAGAEASNYPFCTIDPNVGVVSVPDPRVDRLTEIYRPAKVVPTSLEFLDIAGLVKGASKGEGLGNQFLSHIRDVDAIVHVVRCFDDPNVVHVDGSVDPKRDIEIVETELILKDLETVEKKIVDAERRAKSGDKKAKSEADMFVRLQRELSLGRLAHYFDAQSGDESLWLRDAHLLTDKPVMYVCNVNEQDTGSGNAFVEQVRTIAAKEGANVVVVSAAVEAEVAELPVEERAGFLSGLGLQESGLSKVIREGYALLRLITFYTAGPKEVHAWTVKLGSTIQQAAGIIHSDFEKGFIRAEIMKFQDLDRYGSEAALRDKGLIHVEGKEYLVEDGDIVFVRFNV
ncbi:MAG TPA: redox-regulated ATPase YchF [Bacteroidota bacterium]